MDSLSAAAHDVITRGMPLSKAADGYYRVDNRKIIDGRIV